MSTCEAELIALADCAIKLLYILGLLDFLGHTQAQPIEVFTDNKAAYNLCRRFTLAQNSRHINRKLFKMRELQASGLVTVSHIPTESNPADLFTKVLDKRPFEKHRKFMMNLPRDAGQKQNAMTKKLRKCVNDDAPVKGGQHATS